MAMGKFKLALKDFESVKKSRPRDRDAQVHISYHLITTVYSSLLSFSSLFLFRQSIQSVLRLFTNKALLVLSQ